MSVNYKGHLLPEFKEKNWHILIDPLLRELIDNDETHNLSLSDLSNKISTYDLKLDLIENDINHLHKKLYPVIKFNEINNEIYSLRQYGLDWIIYHIVDNKTYFTQEMAEFSDYPNLTAENAYNNKESLEYKSIIF